MDRQAEAAPKKVPLEELTKEELIGKCKNFLAIAQKAKQSKDLLVVENNELKERLKANDSDCTIKALKQQNSELLVSLDELRSQKSFFDGQYREREKQLYDLDTANQSYKRQVTRLTEENENLISQLDSLEKQIEELKKIGLEQQEQLLELEKSNIHKPLDNIENELLKLNEKLDQKDKNIHQLGEELISKNDFIQNLEKNLKCMKEDHSVCISEKSKLENNVKKLEDEISNLKVHTTNLREQSTSQDSVIQKLETELKNSEKKYLDCKSDLNEIEIKIRELQNNLGKLEKKSLVIIEMENKLGKLQKDLANVSEGYKTKLSFNNDIIANLESELKCSQTQYCDLKEIYAETEKELYEYKTKLLDKNKELERNNNLIDDLTTELHKYRALSQQLQRDVQNSNSKLADNQIISSGVASDLENANEKLKQKLKTYHGKIVKFAGDVKKLKEAKNQLLTSFKLYANQVEEWKSLLAILVKKVEKESLEKCQLELENRNLQKKITELHSTEENKLLKEEMNNLEQKRNYASTDNDSRKLDTSRQHLEPDSKLIVKEDEPTDSTEMNHIKAIFQASRDDSQELVKENEQMYNQIVELQRKEQKLSTKIELLKGHVQELNKVSGDNEKLRSRVEELLQEIAGLNAIIEELRSKEITHQEQIKNYMKEIESLSNYRMIVEEVSKEIQESEGDSADLGVDLKSKIAEREAFLKKYVRDIDYLKKVNDDLLWKLNENKMNEVRLNSANKDLMNNISEYKALLEKYLKDIDTLEVFTKESNQKLHLFELRSSELVSKNNELLSRVQSCESVLDKYERSIKAVEGNMANGDSTNTELNELKAGYEDMMQKLKYYENKSEKYDHDIKQLHQINKDLNGKIAEYEIASAETEKLKSLNQELKEINSSYEDEIKLLRGKNVELSKQSDKSRSEELQLAEMTGGELRKQANKNKELIEKIETLNKQIDALKNKPKEERNTQTESIEENPSRVDDFDDQIQSLKRENAELLSEMNVMNQALKERGELISKQQSYCEEIARKMQLFEAQNAANHENLLQKDETIELLRRELKVFKNDSACTTDPLGEISKKNTEISRLKCEIVELKEKISSQLDSSEYNYPDSETMSALSAVSKSEELSRMKDIEGSWEERYGKLRNLAIKLKAKVRQLTDELTKEQSEKNDLQQKLAKTKQSYQQQIDLLQDQLEASSKEIKTYVRQLDGAAIEINNDKKKLADYEEHISELKMQMSGLERDKQAVEDWKKNTSAKVSSLKKELESNAALKKQFENQINKLQSDIEAKERALKTEIERHNETKASLLEFTNECKKQSVLNLEIQDYERSVKDLSHKIEKRQELINKLRAQIDVQRSSLETLQEQSRTAEDHLKTYEKQLMIANQDNELHKRKILELQAVLSEKELRIQDLTQSIENTRTDNEELSTQLSRTVMEHEKTHVSLQQECDLYKRRYLGLEDSLREVRRVLNLREQELADMQADYESYKVRAQSVLRQTQSRDVLAEERLKEEASSLRAQVEILASELDECKVYAENVSRENSDLLTQQQEVRLKLEATESELQSSRFELERLSEKHQHMLVEHTETVRGLKLHGDTLAQCYRQQISDLEERHRRELDELRSSTPPHEQPALSAAPPMPREEGEGSESVEGGTVAASSFAPSRLLPLDKLLEDPEPTESYAARRRVLHENEAKVAHLTALLADTEQDLAKHVQMNRVLKEEIRRQQRSVEREEHAENLEYLKNIVYKFLTLGQGDERERLVPVLNTILKLSPEENQKLILVAKGQKSWSNYLPMWKPQ